MLRRHSNYLVFAKILGLFETAERAWVVAFGERVLLFSFGVVINLLWVMGGRGSVVMSTSDSGTASECWRVSRNLALGFFAVTVTVWVWLELEVEWVGWPLAFETLVCFIFFLVQVSRLRYLLPVVAMLRLNGFYFRVLSLFFDVIIRQVFFEVL